MTGVGAENLGHHFVEQLVARGAKRVYATARRPELIDVPGVEVLHLDLTDRESINAAAAVARDVDLLVNNAAVFAAGLNFTDGDPALIRGLFDTNVHGTLDVIRAFAPGLAANGGGAILNVLSSAAWATLDGINVYGASKAAAWSMTNGLRSELAGQGTFVSALIFGMAATPPLRAFADAVAGPGVLDALMTDPAVIVGRALDGLESGRLEILADQLAIDAKAALSSDAESVYQTLGAR
ncbi:short-chain dehydrogenase [Winogradskya humida]|uniref:Short-chain dehydrogenase n=1 Tax=Winogradskya humida TaxID=113566 RepID=A0ABQ4A170_9ACTN|nr:short-chain dehydrogenase [Actinoplanes humidus]